MRINPKNIFSAALMLLAVSFFAIAQDEPKSTTLSELKNSAPPAAPSAADVMRSRIARAKAYLVVKNYTAAIYDLENIRRETNDPTVHRVLNVLLMHAYLEQGEYTKAQKFLKELDADKSRSADYFAVAGQVISGARSQLSRYHALGIPVTDRSLPEAAANDLDGMRETLELVAAQSRAKGNQKDLSATASAVYEEASAARGNLGRDEYEERLWQNQVAEAREQLINPRTRIMDVAEQPIAAPEITLVATTIDDDDPPFEQNDVASEDIQEETGNTGTEIKPVSEDKSVDDMPGKRTVEKDTGDSGVADKKVTPADRKVIVISSADKKTAESVNEDAEQPNVKSTDQAADTKSAKKTNDGTMAADKVSKDPMPMGSLISYATRRVTPVYPPQARTMRMQGTVTVEVIVDEDGNVSKVEKTVGPALLKRAAREAVEKWQFTPFTQDGQPVKAAGYVSFNFNL